MRQLLLAIFLLAACATIASAQSTGPDRDGRIEVFGGFSANDYFNYVSFPPMLPDLNFSPFLTSTAGGKGFATSITGSFNGYLGITGEFSVYFDNVHSVPLKINVCHTPGSCTASTQNSDGGRTAFYFLAGPEIKGRNRTRLTPFARALFGGVASHASFATAGPALTHSDSDLRTAFAMDFGGGLDVRINNRLSIRGTADYTGMFLRDLGDPDSGALQNHLRLSIGVAYRFH